MNRPHREKYYLGGLTVNFDESVPLPIGTRVDNSTIKTNPLAQIYGEDIKTHDTTDNGWPAIITLDIDEGTAGVAISYPGTWHRWTATEEVNLICEYRDGELIWYTIAAFGSKPSAVKNGRYEIQGYDSYEIVPWNADDRLSRMDNMMDKNVTPIVCTESRFTSKAYVMQKADDINVLNRMFRLENLNTLTKRRKRVFEEVVPQEVRCEDNPLQDVAKRVLGGGGAR